MITSQLASYGGGLLALYLFLFMAPLILGFFVAYQDTAIGMRALVGSLWVGFVLTMVVGVIVLFSNFTEFNLWAPLAVPG
jgi:hypothetical protein